MAMASLSCRCSLGAFRIGVLKIQRPTRRRTRSWVFVNGVGRKTSCAIENWWMYGHFFSRPRLIQLPSAAARPGLCCTRKRKQFVQSCQSTSWSTVIAPCSQCRSYSQPDGFWSRVCPVLKVVLSTDFRKVSPEMAAISEPIPSRVTLDLLGSAVYILSTEELLLDALTRQPDRLVSWKCDAVVLLRNRTIDWMRFRALSRHFPLAAERALQLQKECLIPVPRSILLKLREPGHLRRRLSALRVDYRQVAWANNENHSLHGFATYVLRRLLRITRPAQE